MKKWFEGENNSLDSEELKNIKKLSRDIFSSKLKLFRKSSGLTLKELGELSNTSDSYLSQLENGRRNPPKPELLMNIATGLSKTNHTIKGDPTTRETLQDVERIYIELFDAAGYRLDSDTLTPANETNTLEKEEQEFLNSYNRITKDFYLNYKSGEESLDKLTADSPPEKLRFLLYMLNEYKNDSSKNEFEQNKTKLMNYFIELIDSIDQLL